jgi:UDP-N-acetylglucosamine/UDP-N-acetylgalactosamine diphosphorylase
MDFAALKERFIKHGQQHVFRFWDDLDAAARSGLISQLQEVDLEEIDNLVATLVKGSGALEMDWNSLEPAPFLPLPEKGGDPARWVSALQLGEEALRAGRVAAFTVAGGQGTRLGFDGPKGTFPVTPVLKKTLFQVFAEKLLAVGRRYGTTPHWFIMTSHQNHEATTAFLAEHNHFGLSKDRVHCFRQGRMPAVDFQGRLILESKASLAMSPDGHGGSLRALVRSGATAIMKAEGVDVISYFQVDNPLVRCIDPAFIGLHLAARSEMSSKMIPKAYPGEKVGHFCKQGDRTIVVEYSDLPKELQEQRTPSGELRFVAGSIAIHILDRAFVERMGATGGLVFHRAEKKIPYVDASGNQVKPEKPNGVKFEMFVFDALPFAANPIIVETLRENDFSPVKNAEGLDSPKTCAEDQLRQFTRWANSCGAGIPTDASGLPPFAFEVSPLFGYDEASFAESWKAAPPPAIRPGDVLTR